MSLELAHADCKNIQKCRTERRVKPTASDLKFDFTLSRTTICQQCMLRQACQVAALLNLPVMDCTYFVHKQVN